MCYCPLLVYDACAHTALGAVPLSRSPPCPWISHGADIVPRYARSEGIPLSDKIQQGYALNKEDTCPFELCHPFRTWQVGGFMRRLSTSARREACKIARGGSRFDHQLHCSLRLFRTITIMMQGGLRGWQISRGSNGLANVQDHGPHCPRLCPSHITNWMLDKALKGGLIGCALGRHGSGLMTINSQQTRPDTRLCCTLPKTLCLSRCS